MYAVKRAGAEARVGFDETVALLGLGRLLDRPVAKLSGGEGRRVAIARALLSQPELMLLDEPLSGLDLDAKEEALSYLERLQAELAVPMLFVSHDPAEVARLADRVLLMQAGRIVETPTSAVAGAAALDAEAARARLEAETPDRIARLALAALLAGLQPPKLG
jgi:molybdate transport system ATP-binding protein